MSNAQQSPTVADVTVGVAPVGIDAELAEQSAAAAEISEILADDTPESAQVVRPSKEEAAAYVQDRVIVIGIKYRDKTMTEGQKNLEIGDDGLDLAIYQRELVYDQWNDENYNGMINLLCSQICIHVSKTPKQVQLPLYVQSAAARRAARVIIGDGVDHFTYYEWVLLSSRNKTRDRARAFTFNKKTLESTFSNIWVDFVRKIAAARATNPTAYRASGFDNVVVEFEQYVADAERTANPAAHVTAERLRISQMKDKSIKTRTAAVSNAIQSALSAIPPTAPGKTDGVDPAMTPNGILSQIVDKCVVNGIALPNLGLSAVTCTNNDLMAFVNEMVKYGRWSEIQILHAKLEKVIAKRARTAEAPAAPAPLVLAATGS